MNTKHNTKTGTLEEHEESVIDLEQARNEIFGRWDVEMRIRHGKNVIVYKPGGRPPGTPEENHAFFCFMLGVIKDAAMAQVNAAVVDGDDAQLEDGKHTLDEVNRDIKQYGCM